MEIKGKVMSTGHRYTKEDWDAFFKEIVEQGIPPTGRVSLDWWKKRTGRNISKATIQYRVNPSSRNHSRIRTQRYRKESPTVILSKKIGRFCTHSVNSEGRNNPERVRDFKFHLKNKITRFSIKGTDKLKRYENMNFSSEDLISSWKQKYSYNEDDMTVKCYLTGKTIDLRMTNLWHMDHIDPRGPNTIDNCAPTLKEANQAKSDLSVEELVQLAKDILSNFGEESYANSTICAKHLAS